MARGRQSRRKKRVEELGHVNSFGCVSHVGLLLPDSARQMKERGERNEMQGGERERDNSVIFFQYFSCLLGKKKKNLGQCFIFILKSEDREEKGKE